MSNCGPSAAPQAPLPEAKLLIPGERSASATAVAPTVAPTPPPPPPSAADEKAAKEAELEGKVDEFLANHGKPPRDFVRFSLDPSLENAVRWVTSFQKDFNKSDELAKAWEQASQMVEAAKKSGVDLPGMVKDDGPKVIDYAKDLPPEVLAKLKLEQTPLKDDPTNIRRVNTNNPYITLPGQTPVDLKKKGGSLTPDAPGGVVLVNYYFSAECPFCHKFEPILQTVIEELGPRVQVTCVDMTPAERAATNVLGKIDCEWRPLRSGEKDSMGVEATPTLIVNRGPNLPLERVAGVVDAPTLYNYLLGQLPQEGIAP